MAKLCRVHLRLNMDVLPSRICPDVLLATGKQQVLIYLQYLYTKAHPASGCRVYYSLFSQLYYLSEIPLFKVILHPGHVHKICSVGILYNEELDQNIFQVHLTAGPHV